MIDSPRRSVLTFLPAGGGVVLALVLLGGCGAAEKGAGNASPEAGDAAAQASEATPAECVVGQGTIAADATTADWVGSYAVALISSDGRRVDGTLTLADQSEEFRAVIGPGGEVAPNTRIPLYGWTDLDAAEVGAIVPGSTTSQDPEAPGIAVLESRMGNQAPNILLRLGTEANQRGLVRFDGAFTVMLVTEIDSDGFRGRWNSGVGVDRAEGSFCAFAQ
jgi:hypothetical protein